MTLYLDPPPSPDGYLPYNDFTVWWTEPEADRNRIAGYELSTPIPVVGGSLTRQVGKQGGRLIVKNADNTPYGGAYTVKVAAVDLAGNFGPEVSIDIRLNRYKPVTRISSIDYEMDASDNLQVRLVGRGFTTGGSVAEIYLDQDATPPFDYTLRRDARQYEVPDDNDIRGITIGADYDSGTYYVGVRHTARGIEWGSQQVPYLAPGTVKVGDFSFRWLPRWASARTSRYHVPFVTLLIAACVGLVTVLFVVSSRRVLATAREGTMLRGEVLALIEGRPSLRTVEEAERRIRRLRRRGIGLRLKFSFLVSVLAILIVVGLAVPLGMQMVKRERLILAEELKNRSSLLLDSVAERAVSPLRPGSSGVATVSSIPASIDAMPGEALFLTVTGPSDPPAADPTDLDYIWATNDPSWPEGSFVPGRVQLADADLPRETVARFASELNAEVATTLADQLTDAARLKVESDRLLDASRAATATAEDVQAYEAMGLRYAETRNELRSQIRKLATQGDWSGSKPEFEPDRLQGQYLFYRPVAEYNEKGYFTLGMVRLRISTTKIQDQIDEVTRELVTLMLIISAAAVGAGIVGAVILAGITIRPIRPLVAGVAKIRDTEDQKELEEIPVKTRDEIGMLAEAVNEMVRDLVRAAKEREELLVGKSVQKRFLPLEEVGGEKGSTGGLKNDRVEIYGYYEGAKGVSGDYFDFQKLDDRYYAIINCDVAGKGVPAAMIMVEVATLFLGWCRDWTRRHDGRNGGLSGLVSTINDMLEERGFKGRFAQLTVGLYDVDMGLLTVCTAGNNVLHVYDADRGAILEHPLPPTLAAGTVPSMLVEAKGGYPQIALPLDRGDALFLFTDGFEESKRSFRTLAGDIVPCNEPGLKDDDPHLGTHLKGQTSEEFGIPRITGIVNAVFGRGSYRLERHHTASREDLEFDFRDCTGTVKDAVLALVCVEKVFRVYRDLLTDAGHRVHVEAKVDAFLRKHFRQYDALFGQRLEVGGPAGTVVYSRLEEDPQYDDLTLIVVRRPQGVVAR